MTAATEGLAPVGGRTRRDLPMLFSGPMVRAMLAGLKTETRRVVVDAAAEPRWRAGDRLWVKESWRTSVGADDRKPRDLAHQGWPLWYDADDGEPTWTGARTGGPAFATRGRRRASIHLPRWASRLTLRVSDVRVERLRDIDDAGALAEGTREPSLRDLGGDLGQAAWSERQVYERLWRLLHGPSAWDDDPWVAVISFDVERVAVPRDRPSRRRLP